MSHVVEMTTVALVLGLRHGLDADHLAAIDGLTRSTYSESPGVSRQCGVLFSTGHSTVIALAACVLGLAGRGWTPAPWLEQMGKTVAATVLLVLGIYNLRLALWPTRARTGSPAGPRTAPNGGGLM